MPVSQPPVIIDAVLPARAGSQGGRFFGPFEYSAPDRLYQVLKSQGASPRALNVYKSTDAGASWVNQDTGNHPANIIDYDVAVSGNTFSILYSNGADAGKLTVITYDAATDTFGVAGPGGAVATGGQFFLVRLSTGVLRAFYTKSSGVNKSGLFYEDFSGGVWSGESTVVAEAAGHQVQVQGIVIDSGNETKILYEDFQAGVFPTLSSLTYITVTAGGVVSAPAVIQVGAPGRRFFGGRTVIWNDPNDLTDKIVMPGYDSTEQFAGVWVGSPASAPVWTFTTVDNIAWGPSEADQDAFASVGTDGVLYLFWNSEDFSDPDPANIIDRTYYSSNDGTGWIAPILFYDEVTDPQTEDPGIDPYSQFLHAMSMARLSNGLFGVSVALEENGFCAGYYLIDEACDITITVTPHGQAPTVVPDDGAVFVLPPAYGLTPYTFASTPNTPALMQAVEGGGPPQTFEYSIPAGNLPSGMTLGGSLSGPASAPLQTNAGLFFQGTPSENPTVPQTFVIRGRVRLIS